MPTLSQNSESSKCGICKDVGRVYFDEVYNERTYKVSKPCVCRLEAVRRAKLDRIPLEYRNCELSKLIPNPKKHPAQGAEFAKVKADPHSSFLLCGDPGAGKTLLMYALYREAVMNDRKVVACTLSELLNEYRKFIQDSMKGGETTRPRILAEDLAQSEIKYSVFFDDIDKAKPTEYAAEQFYELVNAIYNHGHQVVCTTNLKIAALRNHFDKFDEDQRFGGAILRRLAEKSINISMFRN